MDKKKLQEAAKMIVEATSNGDSSNSAHNDESDWITKKEACKIAKLSRWSISRRIDEGLIRGSKLGNVNTSPVRVYKPSLLAYLDSHVIQPKNARKEEK